MRTKMKKTIKKSNKPKEVKNNSAFKRAMNQIGVKNGDTIIIDANKGTIDVKISNSELQKRKKSWKNIKPNFTSGTIWKYAQSVGSSKDGAVTHPGGFKEKSCYADI